jgi:hypothetical protein
MLTLDASRFGVSDIADAVRLVGDLLGVGDELIDYERGYHIADDNHVDATLTDAQATRFEKMKAVLPNMKVGRNDDHQTQGFHSRENVAEREIRWTGLQPEARVLLAPGFIGPSTLVIEGGAPPLGVPEPIALIVEIGGVRFSEQIEPGSDWFSLRFPTQAEEGEQEVRLSTDHTWKPADVLGTADGRSLGVAVASVSLEPVKA